LYSANLDSSDCFLDDATGDYYNLSTDLTKWEPVGNIGMHRRKAAEDRRLLGSTVLQTKPFRVRSHEPRGLLAQNSFDPEHYIIQKITREKTGIIYPHFEKEVWPDKYHISSWVYCKQGTSFKVVDPSP